MIQSKSLTLNSPGDRRSKILSFVLVTNAYIAKSSRVSTKPKNETPDEVTSPFADLVKAIIDCQKIEQLFSKSIYYSRGFPLHSHRSSITSKAQ